MQSQKKLQDTTARPKPKLELLIKHAFEKLAGSQSAAPSGYRFVPKGIGWVSTFFFKALAHKYSRRLTKENKQTLFVVYDELTHDRLGLRCPSTVFDAVNADNIASAPGRRDVVLAKDQKDIKTARETMLRLFPRIPLSAAEAVLEHGFQKGSGRVGRVTTLESDEKVTLAVIAHIRHQHTHYETLLQNRDQNRAARSNQRVLAREAIKESLQAILKAWRPLGKLESPESQTRKQTRAILQPVARLKGSKARSTTQAASLSVGSRQVHSEDAKFVALTSSIHAVHPLPLDRRQAHSQNTAIPGSKPQQVTKKPKLVPLAASVHANQTRGKRPLPLETIEPNQKGSHPKRQRFGNPNHSSDRLKVDRTSANAPNPDEYARAFMCDHKNSMTQARKAADRSRKKVLQKSLVVTNSWKARHRTSTASKIDSDFNKDVILPFECPVLKQTTAFPGRPTLSFLTFFPPRQQSREGDSSPSIPGMMVESINSDTFLGAQISFAQGCHAESMENWTDLEQGLRAMSIN